MMDEIAKIVDHDPRKKTIAEFFDGKNIFITGGTGFLGTVLIEHLLSATPNIGNIYLLIRAKRGFSVESRIQRLLSKAVGIFSIFIWPTITRKASSEFFFMIHGQYYSLPLQIREDSFVV